MPTPLLTEIITQSYSRSRFVGDLLNLMPDTRLLWMPTAGDTTVNQTLETSTGRVVTYDATVAARLSTLKSGVRQTFNGIDQFGTTPDTTDLSFGNSVTDQAFSLVALAFVNDTAVSRPILTKWLASNREWLFSLGAADVLTLQIMDESVAAQCFRASDAAITQGSWHVFGATYSGVGGATAANGITLYQDGAVIASTATNNASYVAMENLTAPVDVGRFSPSFFDGSLALAVACQKALTTADHAAIVAMCQKYFGAP